MDISEQWLREWVDPAADSAELARLLTMAGLEVDGVKPVAGDFSGVVVGEILACEPHPKADRLSLCKVETGGETATVVCGAPNARVGLKAPLARVGATLPGGRVIEAVELRGVASQGMLCAESELGMSEDGDGLMELAADAPVGTDLREYLGLDDRVIELDLTPNRADCLSVRGVAREVGLLTGAPLSPADCEPVHASCKQSVPVSLGAPDGCPRYLGRVIQGVDVSRPSPPWLRERLRRAGLRSIGCVVDVTNYVLLELGQPLHAFDLDKLSGGIDVRWAHKGEPLTLLDGQEVRLDPETLVIADDSGAVAMAGVMGGQATAVSDGTRNIMLESAFFAPLAITGRARALRLHTDAAHRFERGVDWQLQRDAMERATRLLIDIAGGEAGPITEAVADTLPAPVAITLRRSRIPRLLGFEMEDAEVERILRGLGMEVLPSETGSETGSETAADIPGDTSHNTSHNTSHDMSHDIAGEKAWTVTPPSWRFDMAIEADLLEELARVHGYDKLPSARVRATLAMPAARESTLSQRDIRRRLAARDYREAITWSFVDPKWQRAFDPDLEPVALQNPIAADLAVMRTSLLPGLMDALVYNVHRQQSRVRLFETGLRFLPGGQEDGGLEQRPTLAGVLTGPRGRENWAGESGNVDFYDVRGDVESLLALTGVPERFAFRPGVRAGLQEGRTAVLYRNEGRDEGRDEGRKEGRNETPVGHLGALHPALQAEYRLGDPVYIFELDLEALLRARLPAYREISRYPGQRRDIAVVVDRAVSAGELLATVRDAAGPDLTELSLFDVYEGEGIDPERKSLAMGLTFQAASRTLEDEEINRIMDQVIDVLTRTHRAELRG